MTPEQINIAIAESLGWTDCKEKEIWTASSRQITKGLRGTNPEGFELCFIPNYHGSLDACSEIMQTLNNSQLYTLACHILNVKPGMPGNFGISQVIRLMQVDAPTLCVGYLRTIGKLNEGEQKL